VVAVNAGLAARDNLAVLPFSGSAAGEGETIAELFSFTELSQVFSIIPRTSINQAVAREHNFQLGTNMTDPDTAIALGKQLGARYVVSGSITALGSRNMFNAAIIDLESSVQLIGRSENYNTLDDGISVMENLARELTGVQTAAPNPRGNVFGYGVLNLGLGLGSFIQGDWAGGVTLLAGYGAAAGLIVWELSLDHEDKLAGIPGAVGIGVAGVTAIYGFICPMLYQRNQRLAGITDRINIALVPGNRDREAVQFSYTLTF
jgi:TolB-like protein